LWGGKTMINAMLLYASAEKGSGAGWEGISNEKEK
jgi:hypothetical protein